MYFNSLAYIFCFLPVVIIVYFFLNRKKLVTLGKIWLLAASIYFYASFNLIYTPLLLAYVCMNFGFYKLIRKFYDDEKKSKCVLITAIVVNLFILCGFKYCNFFIDAINLSFKNLIPYINIAFPLALSFQTLQQIGFLTDSYKNREMKYSFLDYCLFSVFFPQMIVGPIVKYNETIPQFNNLRRKIFNHKNFIMGLTIFLVGFYKKSFFAVCLNDVLVDKLPLMTSLSTVESWLFCIMEYFHVYLELSGFMDMVIGSALMLNIELPINFNSPMQAKNIVDFWQRWQITFARFMKNYVYAPLKALNPKGWFVDFAILFTCLLGGLWQNTSICAALWGLTHGLGFLIHRSWEKLNIKLPSCVSCFITFMFVAFAGLFFKVQSLSQMSILTSELFSLVKYNTVDFSMKAVTFVGNGSERNWVVSSLLICIIGMILTVLHISVEGKDLAKYVKPNFVWTLVIAIAVVELIYFYSPPARYMYYNF